LPHAHLVARRLGHLTLQRSNSSFIRRGAIAAIEIISLAILTDTYGRGLPRGGKAPWVFNGIKSAMKYQILFSLSLLACGIAGCATDAHRDDHPTPVSVTEAAPPPINADTHSAAGQLAEARGDVDDAVIQYKESLKLNKSHIQSLYRLGCLYATEGKFSDSIAIWNRYLKATANSAFGYSNLAFTEELAGNPGSAEADYKLGLKKDPGNSPCHINYGLMLARHGRIGEATTQLQAVLSPAEVHYNIASVYELQNRKEMALIEYKQALAVDPKFEDARAKLTSLGESPAGED
jgi:tetratricopeptide (TPR) repeat protein